MIRLLLAGLLAALLAGCVTLDSTDATRDPDFYITESPTTPEPYEPLGFVRVEKTGWYLFAYLPIVSVTLNDLVWGNLVPEAKAKGANGIVNLQYDLRPASFWDVVSLGAAFLPDWSAKGVVTGMAVRFRELPENRHGTRTTR